MTRPQAQSPDISGIPERLFAKACHPERPNENYSWSLSKEPIEGSVEYVRKGLGHATPEIGTPLLCLVCAYEKAWKIFDNKTGAAVCEDCAAPRATEGLTVEAALKELREMFPQRSLIVSAFARPDEYSIAVASEDEYEVFSYETLGQCLTEVRAWATAERDDEF